MDLPVLKGVEQVSDGWLKKYVLAYDLPDGRELNYEVVSRKGLEQYGAEIRGEAAAEPSTDAVCIVGHTADDAFLLIREFRFPMNRMCVAFPAGLKEADEDVIERSYMPPAWLLVAWNGRRKHRHGVCRGGARVRTEGGVDGVYRVVRAAPYGGGAIFAGEHRPPLHSMPACIGNDCESPVRIDKPFCKELHDTSSFCTRVRGHDQGG